MPRALSMLLLLTSIVLLGTSGGEGAEGDWPWWRGPSRDGVADADQTIPTRWSEEENILWKTPIPGRGHGSPTVVGNRVYLATAEADREARSVLCLDRETGKVVWSTDVHVGKVTPHKNKKGSDASCSVACDGERLFVNFLHDNAMVTSALSLDGKILWQQRICDYVVHQAFGSSPAIYGPLVIVSADNKAGGAVAGLNRESGEVVWKQSRPKTPNYPSPIILEASGKTQLLMTGCDVVSSFNPLTGEKLWEFPGATTECVTSTIVHDGLMLTSGGYPKNHIAAVKCDGSGTVVWENNVRVYVPSMLVRDGNLYAVTDAGVAMCWDFATGKEMWKGRLGGTFSSSPVLVGDTIVVTNEAGQTFLFRARPDEFELIAENRLGDECFATPTLCGDHIYTRVARQEKNSRQEYLYCIGKK
ncbi:MAG: PQQ-binding-like beta-propeller repeat protein [Planctomycetaceae bacterium]